MLIYLYHPVGLIVGALAERIRFSAMLIFVLMWLTFSYLPMTHMVWAGGYLASLGALDFAVGTVVHINAASAANEIAGLAFINQHRHGHRRRWRCIGHRPGGGWRSRSVGRGYPEEMAESG